MNSKSSLRAIGKTFFEYFSSLYKDSSRTKICFLLDEESFYTLIKNSVPDITITDDNKVSRCKNIFIDYDYYYHLNFHSDSFIALALVVYQVHCCTTAEALDESSIIQSIAEGYDTDKHSISTLYFKPGAQKLLWDTVSSLFNGNIMSPLQLIPQGTSGCNVQYTKVHRVFSVSELSRCKKHLFPFLDDTSSFDTFLEYKINFCNLLYRNNLNDSELFVLYKLYCYWLNHKKDNITTNHINRNSNITLRISVDKETPSVIDKDGELVSSRILNSDLIDDILFFYFDSDYYSTKKIEEPDYVAVLLNIRNPLFNNSLSDSIYPVDFIDNSSDFRLVFYDEASFILSPFFQKSGMSKHDFFFMDGIRINRNEYIKGFLPIIHCESSVQSITITAINNSSYSKDIQIENNKLDLNNLSNFFEDSGFLKFRISSKNSNRTFSIITEKKTFSGSLGWNFSNLKANRGEP